MSGKYFYYNPDRIIKKAIQSKVVVNGMRYNDMQHLWSTVLPSVSENFEEKYHITKNIYKLNKSSS